MRAHRIWSPIVLLAGVILVGCNAAAASLPPTATVASAPIVTPAPTASPRQSAAAHTCATGTATGPAPTDTIVVLPSLLPDPDGAPVPGDLIGRIYGANPLERLGCRESHLTLRAADDPQCMGIYGGRSTCFTILWSPVKIEDGKSDPAARGSARIVDGNLVLGFAWVPNDRSCEHTFGTFAIEAGGSTLRAITPVCAYRAFREITLTP